MKATIDVQCQCCGTTQELSEMFAHKIFGFTIAQVQHILHDYREQVPHAEAHAKRMDICSGTRRAMYNILERIVLEVVEHDKVSIRTLSDLKVFLECIGDQSKPQAREI